MFPTSLCPFAFRVESLPGKQMGMGSLLFSDLQDKGRAMGVDPREALAPALIKLIALAAWEDACTMKVSF